MNCPICGNKLVEVEGDTVLCDHATGPEGWVASVGNLVFHVYRRPISVGNEKGD